MLPRQGSALVLMSQTAVESGITISLPVCLLRAMGRAGETEALSIRCASAAAVPAVPHPEAVLSSLVPLGGEGWLLGSWGAGAAAWEKHGSSVSRSVGSWGFLAV